MQATTISKVGEVLSRCSKEVEDLSGAKIIAFFLNRVPKEEISEKKIDKLKRGIEHVFGCQWNVLRRRSRKRELVRARQLFFWYGYEKLGMTTTELGNIFSFDHTSVLHGLRTMNDLIDTNDKSVLENINLLEMFMEMEDKLITNEIHS